MFINCDTIVDALGDLPPTPVVAVRILKLMQDPWVSATLLAKAIAHDPAVSARILKTANSPIFYAGQKVSTLEHAIVILGETNLRNLVLETSLRGVNKSFGLLERKLWEDSIGCAMGTRIVTRHFDAADPEEGFLAGLFRNIGKLVMNNHSKETYKQIVEAVQKKAGSLADMERAFFAFTHEEVGAAVLEKWNFPSSLILSTLHHHDMALPEKIEPDILRLTAAVNVAGSLCRHLNIGQIGHKMRNKNVDLTQEPGALILGINQTQIEEISDEFKAVFKKERAFFLT